MVYMHDMGTGETYQFKLINGIVTIADVFQHLKIEINEKNFTAYIGRQPVALTHPVHNYSRFKFQYIPSYNCYNKLNLELAPNCHRVV